MTTPESVPEENIKIKGNNIGLGVCLECIGSYKLHVNDLEKMANEEPPPDMYFAVSMAPTWCQQAIPGQIIIQAVAVPTCFAHLGVNALTPAQKAAQSGLIIPG